MRILIAEDDLISRRMLAAVLRKAGHDPVEAVNGLEAWEALQKPDAPRIAILDWMMPEMDGLEVLRRVRALPGERSPYILILTSKTGKAEIIAGLDAGANDYLAKSFDTGELRARIEVGCRMVAMQDALDEKIVALQQALDEIKTLRGIIPICAYCKKIRDDKGFWSQVEAYVKKHTGAEFSHGICPECLRKIDPELADDIL